MNDKPANLPFPIDPNYIYILTDKDRKDFAPKLATDEYWNDLRVAWLPLQTASVPFMSLSFYRRRKSSGWVSVTTKLPEPDPNTNYLVELQDKVGAVHHEILSGCNMQGTGWRDCQFVAWRPLELSGLAKPPRPAAEVAYNEWQKTSRYTYTSGGEDVILKTWLAAIEWAKANKGEI